jgi:hypothetical protein
MDPRKHARCTAMVDTEASVRVDESIWSNPNTGGAANRELSVQAHDCTHHLPGDLEWASSPPLSPTVSSPRERQRGRIPAATK